MNKKTGKARKVKFIVSEPPFHFDPYDKGAMEKLERANKTGLGKIVREKEDQQNSKDDSAPANPSAL